MNILLINAATDYEGTSQRSVYFPTGILSVAASLKREGHAVRVLDLNIDRESFEPLLDWNIAATNPQLVGIGGLYSSAWPHQKRIAQFVKSRIPNVPIVVGGIHPTMFAQEILERYSFIDYVVLGEGELTACYLADAIALDQSASLLDGIAFRKDGSVIVNPKTRFADVESLPEPDYSLVSVEKYSFDTSGWHSPKNIPVGRPFPILTSRSCPKRCSFCSMHLVHGQGIRHRSTTSVVDEMEHLHHAYGATYFEIMDDNLTCDRGHVLSFCSKIRSRGLDIQFCTPNGVAVEGFDDEVCSALVDAGLVRVCLAIESGSEFIRNKAIGKKLSNEQIDIAMRACEKQPTLFVGAFFVFGMPQETSETLAESVKMATSLPLDKAWVFFATPYPGTALHRLCVRDGLIEHQDLLENPMLKSDTDSPHFKPPNVSIEELQSARQTVLDHYKTPLLAVH